MPRDTAQVPGAAERMQTWLPMTFQERGVAMPFTTPHLAGARLRMVEGRRLEMLLPQVVGRGIGVVPWERVGLLCSPTLFDRRLGTRLAALPALTPAAVRQAVCAEAAAGLAGPAAQNAATHMQAADAAEIGRARDELRVCEPHTGAAAGVSALAALLGPVGIGPARDTARLPRTLAAVIALAEQLGDRQRTGAVGGDADLAATAARRTADAATEALTAARAAATDPSALLGRWDRTPEGVTAELSRAEWLLEGWAWLCGLWATPDARLGHPTVTVPELAALVPPLPGEMGAAAWGVPRHELPDPIRGLLRGGDWRSGITPQDLIARNEALLIDALLVPGMTR